MAQAPDGNDTLTPDDAAKILEELLDAQNSAKLLGLMLNIKLRDAEAIINSYKHPKEQLLHIILAFLQQAELKPTWRAIVDALRSPVVGLTALANKIESSHFPDVIVSRKAVPQTAESAGVLDENEVKSKPSTTQLTPTTTSDNELHMSFTSNDISKRIAEMKKLFDQLKKTIRDCLEKRKFFVKDVADALTSASADEDEQHKLFLDSHVSVLFRAADVPELFGTMNLHWNYLHPSLLDHLVQTFELEEVKGEMESYKSDLKRFIKETSLILFCSTQKRRRPRLSPDFREMVAEFDWPEDETLTLEIVEQFRQEYASQYNLRDCAMMVAQIRPGSFIITWIIPESIVKVLRGKPARAVLKKFSVTRLDIDGVCVYRQRKPLENIPVATIVPVEGAPLTTKSRPAPTSQAKPQSEEDYLYVEQPSEDFFCPVMMGLLLHPHLTSCCGNHLSQEAAERIQLQGEGGMCPLCKEEHWSTVLDKRFQRQVNSLRVFCRHEERGCGWQGELASYQNHVASCPFVEGPLMTELAKLPVYSEEEVPGAVRTTTPEASGVLRITTPEGSGVMRATPEAVTPKASGLMRTTTLEASPSTIPMLTVKCSIRGETPLKMRRGSAVSDERFAYFTPLYSNIYKFEYETEKWHEPISSPCHDSGLAIVNGELTAIGGEDTHQTNTLMTLRGSQWVEVYPPMTIDRKYPAVVTTKDGTHHIVIGGLKSGLGWSTSIEIFNGRDRKWRKARKLPEPLSFPSATISGDQLYVIGQDPTNVGYSCSLQILTFDGEPILTSLIIQPWNLLPNLPVVNSTPATLCGHLVLVGGRETWKPVNSIYQLMDGEWVKIGSMNVARFDCLVVNQSPDKIIIVGGEGDGGETDIVEECINTCMTFYSSV